MKPHYANEIFVQNGLLSAARQCHSPNFDARPPNSIIDLLVIHCIALPPEEYGGSAIEEFFCNRLDVDSHPFYKEIASVQVSAHLLIRRDGEVLQFVNFSDRAWHAGESCFKNRERCNDFSIGIELEGSDTDLFTSAQYEVLANVTRALQAAYPDIGTANIVGHQHIAPQRKTDPGEGFDWRRYRAMLCD